MTETRNMVILIVEDIAAHARLMEYALAELNPVAVFRHVQDGQSAIDYLTRQGRFGDAESAPTPALVLLDLNIPRVDGFQVLEAIRTMPGCGRLPVAVLSSSSNPRDMEAAYAAGADGYLVKPQGFEELIVLLRGVVNFWLRPPGY